MTETEITDLKKNIKNVSTGSLQCRYNKKTYYLVYEPTGINDWTIVGIIHNDVVDASMRRIQFITIVLILILNGCIRPASYRYCFCPDGFQAAHERT